MLRAADDQPQSPNERLLTSIRARGRLTLWLIGIRDLQWRRRRFAVAAAAASLSLALALALLLAGISAALSNEIRRTITSFHADAWLVRAGSPGPFTSPAPFSPRELERVRALPGVRAGAQVVISQATRGGSKPRQVNVNGVTPGAVGAPSGSQGRELRAGPALADASLGVGANNDLVLNGIRLRVIGLLHGRTYFAGVPTVVVTLRDAQRIAFDGLPLVTAIITRGVPGEVPRSLTLLTSRQARDDLDRPVARARQTLALIRILLWIVAATIIGTFVYLSGLGRSRELAVLRSIGIPARALVIGLEHGQLS